MPRIARVVPDDWERVRTVRLRALADAPDAFGTTLAEDEARPLPEWRGRLGNPQTATFLASVGAEDVGIVTGTRYDGREGAAGLFGMWVAPAQRGRGVGGALVDAMVAWARGEGFLRIFLDVGDRNPDAIRLYASRGFVPTGRVGSLPPPREHVREHERVLTLRTPGAGA